MHIDGRFRFKRIGSVHFVFVLIPGAEPQLPADLEVRNPKFKNNIVDENWKGVHPYEFYNIRIMGKMDGVIFSVHPLVSVITTEKFPPVPGGTR